MTHHFNSKAHDKKGIDVLRMEELDAAQAQDESKKWKVIQTSLSKFATAKSIQGNC